jgi:hypothetical protein
MATSLPLYHLHELSFRTQYAELKERSNAAGELLRGTPGSLYQRNGTGHAYWYRIYYPVPGKQAEEFVGSIDDPSAHQAMLERIAFAEWMAKQVANLRKLQFQVADKGVASVVVELHNRKVFEAGLMVVGTLAYMCWLNELGAMAIAARTQDIDLARRQRLKLATSVPFLASVQATQLPFVTVPGMPSQEPSTSVKLPGREGLRVDILAPGSVLGQIVQVPELEWHAQAIPHYDYMLEGRQKAAMLAGGHCIPISLPQAERMIWHKLYTSADRSRSAEKAAKDLLQAVTLAAVLTEQQGLDLKESFAAAPAALQTAALSVWPRLQPLLEAHPETLDVFRSLPAARSLRMAKKTAGKKKRSSS